MVAERDALTQRLAELEQQQGRLEEEERARKELEGEWDVGTEG